MTNYRVRKFEYQDINHRVAWFNSPEIYSKMPIEIPVSIARTQQWFSKIAVDENRADFVFETQNEDIELAVMAGLVSINLQHSRSELYILVSPNKIGQGLGKMAMQWLCNYAFHHLALKKLFLYTLETNKIARKFYEHLGFQEEGVLKKHHIHNGKRVDRHIHGLLREEWEKLPWCSRSPVSFIIANSTSL